MFNAGISSILKYSEKKENYFGYQNKDLLEGKKSDDINNIYVKFQIYGINVYVKAKQKIWDKFIDK